MAACFKLFAGLIFVLAAGTVMGAEENAVPVTEARIAELVKQLDDDDFALREAAVNELAGIGPAAAAAVAQAAQGESLEASTRAFTILDKWMVADQPKQEAAKEHLGKMAQGAVENATTRRAKALLTKQQNPTNSQAPAGVVRSLFAPGGAGVRLGVARVEMRAMAAVAGGVGGRSISVSIGDGKKTMNVAEGDLKAEIIEDAKAGIKVTVIGKDKEGKEKKTEYAAKDLKELKEKHPEGHKVYEKYAGAMNQLKIKMDVGGIVIGPAAQAVDKAEAVPLTEEELKVQVAKKQAQAALEKAQKEEAFRQIPEKAIKLMKPRKAPKLEQPKPAEGEPKDPLFD
jgi:hypothetical protein